MSGEAFGDGTTTIPNVHWLVDKPMNMCESYLTITFTPSTLSSLEFSWQMMWHGF